jgi:hypothetical protein
VLKVITATGKNTVSKGWDDTILHNLLKRRIGNFKITICDIKKD